MVSRAYVEMAHARGIVTVVHQGARACCDALGSATTRRWKDEPPAQARRALHRGARPRFDKIRLLVGAGRLFVGRRTSTLETDTLRNGRRHFRHERVGLVFGRATFPLGKSRIRHGFRCSVFRLGRLLVERSGFRLVRPPLAGGRGAFVAGGWAFTIGPSRHFRGL